MGDTTAGRVYPELTWVALIIGWFTGVIIAVSIGYAALILGFSIEGSELAANQFQEAQQQLMQAAKGTA